MKQTIEISYSDLRNVTNRIIDLINKTTGHKRERITIKTSINNEIGIQGDEWDYVLIDLQEKEGLILEGLDFYDYFYDEGQLAEETFKKLFWFTLRILLFVILFKWTSIRFKDYHLKVIPGKPDLTIGDLITSRIEGKFIRRQDRVFKINKNCVQHAWQLHNY